MTKHSIFILFISLALSSCGYYVEKEPINAGLTDISPTKLGFASLSSSLFSPRCVQCHAQYASYAGVRLELDSILSAVASNRMPKTGGPLSTDQKQALAAWAALGAPEFPGQAPAPQQPVALQPNWNSLSTNLFVPLCISCHNPNGQARFLDLSTFDAFYSAKDREFGEGKKLADLASPDASYLLQVLADEIEPMPPTWSNLRQLNDEEIQVIREWIRAGLPPN